MLAWTKTWYALVLYSMCMWSHLVLSCARSFTCVLGEEVWVLKELRINISEGEIFLFIRMQTVDGSWCCCLRTVTETFEKIGSMPLSIPKVKIVIMASL